MKTMRYMVMFVVSVLSYTMSASLVVADTAPHPASLPMIATHDTSSGQYTGGQESKSPTVSACDGEFGYLNLACAGGSLIVGIGSGIQTMFSKLMWMGDEIFNLSLDKFVLNFGQFFGYFDEIFKTIWSFTRDIANLLIIGLFVYLAINIILQNQSYGDKKMIVTILTVAVLINFSYLFAKTIVNASNFVAVKLYESGIGHALNTDPVSGSGASSSVTGVGNMFMQLLGVGSWTDTKNTLTGLYNNNDWGTFFLHGFISLVLSIIVGLLLWMGAVLLLWRTIMLCVLLLISAWAFATRLHPVLASSPAGWSGWLDGLLKNAVMAPFMMISIFFAIKIGTEATKMTNGGSIGGLAGEVRNANSLNVLLIYFVIIGFLGLAIWGANKLATVVPSAIKALAPATSAVAAMRGVGWFGRNTLGRYSESRVDALNKKITEQGGKSTWLQRRALDTHHGLSKSSFDLANTKAVTEAVKRLGGSTLGSNVGKGGIVKYFEDQAKRGEEMARRYGATDKNRNKGSEIAGINAGKEHDRISGETEEQRKAKKEAAEQQKNNAAAIGITAADRYKATTNYAAEVSDRNTEQQKLEQVDKDVASRKQRYEFELLDAEANINSAHATSNAASLQVALQHKATLQQAYSNDLQRYNTKRATHMSEIANKNTNISAIENHAKTVEELAAKTERDAAEAELTRIKTVTADRAKKVADAILNFEKNTPTAAQSAASYARILGSWREQSANVDMSDGVGRRIAGNDVKAAENKNMKKLIDQLSQQIQAGNTPPPTP